ncbi:methyltransferase type 12 [Micromonospora inyonensis]|uniref:methyltransferase type 12 n=1 Tax=Micromonospora inyonensis TaxID=47866 RepID=UPI00159F0E6F|nr:methyltransferase type 12 [Micromonospora inyonensis]
MSVVSMCAGQGHDILAVPASRSDAREVSATLVEYEARNVAAAWTRAIVEGLDTVTVAPTDAVDLASYRQAVPADLVIMAGVRGNISDADAQAPFTLCRSSALPTPR